MKIAWMLYFGAAVCACASAYLQIGYAAALGVAALFMGFGALFRLDF